MTAPDDPTTRTTTSEREKEVSLEFPPQPEESLAKAMVHLTRDFDWTPFTTGPPVAEAPSEPGHITVTVIDMRRALIPMQEAYGWFHKSLSAGICDGLIKDFFAVKTDEDRVSCAEKYVREVLGITDLADATYFRQGVWRRELSGAMGYDMQRDHAAHTLNNYLLGWYFFVNCPRMTGHLQQVMGKRDRQAATYLDPMISRFGELWCWVSLLHDVGYILEGALRSNGMEVVDERIASGAQYVRRYFTDIFWRELGIRDADGKQDAAELAQLGADTTNVTLDSPETIVDFLRKVGPLNAIENAIEHEGHELRGSELPQDAIALWRAHFEHFGQKEMAKRIAGMETALYSLIDNGIPNAGVRTLDHGICGGLVLLKYSTIWFRLILACKHATAEVREKYERVCSSVQEVTEDWGYHGTHWWSNVVWATAAVAIHNVQQDHSIPGWYSKLDCREAPLAYLGVLVDMLQEWDRPSSKRQNTVEGADLRINSSDVTIGSKADGRVHIVYGCRDGSARKREERLREELERALLNWNDVAEVQFVDL
ncbi:MAG: hypothetical protein ACYTFA_03540 [Planctomycetota bacterium]